MLEGLAIALANIDASYRVDQERRRQRLTHARALATLLGTREVMSHVGARGR